MNVKDFIVVSVVVVTLAALVEYYRGDLTPAPQNNTQPVTTVVPFVPTPTGPISHEDKVGIAKVFHTNVPDEANYAKGTPAYDLMAISNMKKFIEVGSKQKVAVIGFDVMNLWLENSKNRTIVSISPIDRGIQGTTSSFLVVYTE